MKIHLQIEMPEPGKERKPEYKPSIEDTVRRYIELVDSGHESSVEWIALNKLYAALCKRKRSPRVDNLISMIKPILNKFGYHGVVADGR